MCFYLLELKQNCTKIYVKETFFVRKEFFIRPCSKENVFFLRIFRQKAFFCKKAILKIKVTAFRAQKAFFLSER